MNSRRMYLWFTQRKERRRLTRNAIAIHCRSITPRHRVFRELWRAVVRKNRRECLRRCVLNITYASRHSYNGEEVCYRILSGDNSLTLQILWRFLWERMFMLRSEEYRRWQKRVFQVKITACVETWRPLRQIYLRNRKTEGHCGLKSRVWDIKKYKMEQEGMGVQITFRILAFMY